MYTRQTLSWVLLIDSRASYMWNMWFVHEQYYQPQKLHVLGKHEEEPDSSRIAALEKFKHTLGNSSKDFDEELSEGNRIAILWCEYSKHHGTYTEDLDSCSFTWTWNKEPVTGSWVWICIYLSMSSAMWVTTDNLTTPSICQFLFRNWDKAASSSSLSHEPTCLDSVVFSVIHFQSALTISAISLGSGNDFLF